MTRTNKYGNRSIVIDGIKFDSIAEGKYYGVAQDYAKLHGFELRMQEKFELLPKYRLNDKTYRAINYVPDFTFYENGELVKVVDVKGMQTTEFKIKAKMFCHKYQIPLVLAKLTRNGFEEENF